MWRRSSVLGLLLTMVIVTASPAIAQSNREAPGKDDDRAVVVVVRVSDGVVEILHASPSDEPDPSIFERPEGTDRQRPAEGSDDIGIVFEILDADRNLLGPSPVILHRTNHTFYDARHRELPGGLHGGVHEDPEDVRVFKLPLPPDAAFIRTSGSRPVPIERPAPRCAPCVRKPVLLHPDQPRDPEEVFNIVILGDGFAQADQALFMTKARTLSDGLLGMEPYKRNADRIQIQAIPAVSKDSGVSNYPTRGIEKDTCYDVTGFWQGGDYAGFVGTPEPHRIWDAVACNVPVDDVELKVMLVNIAMYGGRGDFDTGTAYVDMYPDGGDRGFVALAAHEIGHAVAGLGDEYMGCDPVKGNPPKFANITTIEQVEAGTVPWTQLADASELGPNGRLKIVDTVENDAATACTSNPDLLRTRFAGKLGLFWGASFLDAGTQVCSDCSPYGDPRGGNYFRPMGVCRMRNILDDYCRVCANEIEKAIWSESVLPAGGDDGSRLAPPTGLRVR